MSCYISIATHRLVPLVYFNCLYNTYGKLNKGLRSGLKSTIVLPLTSKIIDGDTFPLRIRIPQGTAGLINASDILIDQILAWDNNLFRQELGALPESIIDEVKTALNDFLDL